MATNNETPTVFVDYSKAVANRSLLLATGWAVVKIYGKEHRLAFAARIWPGDTRYVDMFDMETGLPVYLSGRGMDLPEGMELAGTLDAITQAVEGR